MRTEALVILILLIPIGAVFADELKEPLIIPKQLPLITLLGDYLITIHVGEQYVDPGVFSSNGAEVLIDTSMLENKIGVYYIKYSTEPGIGHDNSIIRFVKVIAAPGTIASDNIYIVPPPNPREIWANIRGEMVSVFPSSIDTLIERGYLVDRVYTTE